MKKSINFWLIAIFVMVIQSNAFGQHIKGINTPDSTGLFFKMYMEEMAYMDSIYQAEENKCHGYGMMDLRIEGALPSTPRQATYGVGYSQYFKTATKFDHQFGVWVEYGILRIELKNTTAATRTNLANETSGLLKIGVSYSPIWRGLVLKYRHATFSEMALYPEIVIGSQVGLQKGLFCDFRIHLKLGEIFNFSVAYSVIKPPFIYSIDQKIDGWPINFSFSLSIPFYQF